MGADLITTSAVIDHGREPSWDAMRAALRTLNDDDLKRSDLIEIHDNETRDYLLRCVDEFASAWHEDRRDTFIIRVRGADLFMTGGTSFGDSPSDLFDAVCDLWQFPQVMAAGGFDTGPH